ncbi:hypothetical protein HIC43_005584 [Escherichia coli]|nr:hypothetical protein [Escherichia coli]
MPINLTPYLTASGGLGDWGKYRRILFLAYEHWLLTEELRFRWGALLLQYVLSF